MDTSHLPMIKRCMELAEEAEKAGNTSKAEEWLLLAEKAEAYYAKQDYKTVREYYKDKHGTIN
jgi:hypothetical protein